MPQTPSALQWPRKLGGSEAMGCCAIILDGWVMESPLIASFMRQIPDVLELLTLRSYLGRGAGGQRV